MDLMDMNIMNSVLHEIQDSELPRNVFHYEITESAYAEDYRSGYEVPGGSSR